MADQSCQKVAADDDCRYGKMDSNSLVLLAALHTEAAAEQVFEECWDQQGTGI